MGITKTETAIAWSKDKKTKKIIEGLDWA